MSADETSLHSQMIRDGLKHSVESHRALTDAATAVSERTGKPISEMSSKDVERSAEELAKRGDLTDEERRTLGKAKHYLETKRDAQRETVAIVRGISYDDVRELEKRGESVESLYAKAKSEATFRMASKLSGSDAGERMSYEGFRSFDADAIRQGRSVEVAVGSGSSVTISRTDDFANPYRVWVGGTESFSCNEKNLSAHLEMAKLLCDTGLEFLGPVSADLLRVASVREGSLATARDGDFGENEKRSLLRAVAKIFEIEDFPFDATETSKMSARLKSYPSEKGTTIKNLGISKKILDESGNVRNREAFLSLANKG